MLMTPPGDAQREFVLRRWLPDATPPEGQVVALRRLADELRRMITLIVDTDASEEMLLSAAEAARQFNDRLAAIPGNRKHFGYAESSNAGSVRAFFDDSPMMGRSNPLAPPLNLRVEDGMVRGTAVFGRAYEGPPGHVHGGYVAAAFDECLGMVQSTTGLRAMTGRLTVHYRRPTPLDTELQFAGVLDRVEGRKVFNHATLHAGGILCAEAEGLFVVVGARHFEHLAQHPTGSATGID
jgi:acyl-coenzyme A thioesterase PaaI-like protein